MRYPRVRAFAREIKRHVARDHLFLAASSDDFPRLVDEFQKFDPR